MATCDVTAQSILFDIGSRVGDGRTLSAQSPTFTVSPFVSEMVRGPIGLPPGDGGYKNGPGGTDLSDLISKDSLSLCCSY